MTNVIVVFRTAANSVSGWTATCTWGARSGAPRTATSRSPPARTSSSRSWSAGPSSERAGPTRLPHTLISFRLSYEHLLRKFDTFTNEMIIKHTRKRKKKLLKNRASPKLLSCSTSQIMSFCISSRIASAGGARFSSQTY